MRASRTVGQSPVVSRRRLKAKNHRKAAPSTSQGRHLSELLENEWFLRKVLAHLVDDGLHECRRVCWKWKIVCDALPVKLGHLSPENMSDAAKRFPNARSVGNSIAPMDSNVEETLECATRFRELERLSLACLDDKPSPEKLSSCFRSLSSLSALEIDWDYRDSCSDFLTCLGSLTNLTSLKVETNSYLDPILCSFTELKRISRLHLEFSLFLTADNRPVFPSLANLTHLSLRECADGVNVQLVIEVITLVHHRVGIVNWVWHCRRWSSTLRVSNR